MINRGNGHQLLIAAEDEPCKCPIFADAVVNTTIHQQFGDCLRPDYDGVSRIALQPRPRALRDPQGLVIRFRFGLFPWCAYDQPSF